MLYLTNIETNQPKIQKEVENQEVNWYLKESLYLLKSNSRGSFLSSNENKNSLVTFIVFEWKKREYCSKILHKDLFVTDGSRTFIINSQEVREEVQLESNHEEADTRMLLHAKHASSSVGKILISRPDTDFLLFANQFTC